MKATPGTYAWLSTMGWHLRNGLRLKLMLLKMICSPRVPLDVAIVQLTPEFQTSDIEQILEVQLLFGQGDGFLMLPTLSPSQNPLPGSCATTANHLPWDI